MPSPPASAPGTGRDSEALQDPNPCCDTRGLFHRTDSACPTQQGFAGLPGRAGGTQTSSPLPSRDGESSSEPIPGRGCCRRSTWGCSRCLTPRCSSSQLASWSASEPLVPHARPQPRMQERGGSSSELTLGVLTLGVLALGVLALGVPPWQPQRAGRTTAFFPFPTMIRALTAASESCSPSPGRDPRLAPSPACAWLCRSSCPALPTRGARGNPRQRPPGTNPPGRSAPAPAFHPGPAL